LVFASGSLPGVSLAAIGQALALTPLKLQWLVNAELLPLAALTLAVSQTIPGNHCDRTVRADRVIDRRIGAATSP
jgi:hypothetical protein